MIISRRQFLVGAGVSAATAIGAGAFANYDVIRHLVRSVPILLYHKVGQDNDSLTVSTERFSKDMEYLAQHGYHTLSLDDIRCRLTNELAPMPNKPVFITFDDGYLDNYTNAFSILEKYNLKASFYIITGIIGQKNRVTAAQIREMDAAGMGIGSHTVTHRSLGELQPEEAMGELSQSKAVLEQMLGKNVDFIAYPCGSYQHSTLQLVHKCGYKAGFSVRQGNAMFTDTLAIRRIPVFKYDRSISYIMLRKGLLADIIG
ncbi:MAG: polysaccharide deacetylase family protein [Pelosinus sp.]|nr:polysaccharide deacetylase family protein [Pelosinus sp.]